MYRHFTRDDNDARGADSGVVAEREIGSTAIARACHCAAFVSRHFHVRDAIERIAAARHADGLRHALDSSATRCPKPRTNRVELPRGRRSIERTFWSLRSCSAERAWFRSP